MAAPKTSHLNQASTRSALPACVFLPSFISSPCFFVIFDVEALYLFAWAVSVRETGWVGFIEAAIFIGLLLIGLIYLWRIGALDWSPRKPQLKRQKHGLNHSPLP